MGSRKKAEHKTSEGFEFYWLLRDKIDHYALAIQQGTMRASAENLKLAAILITHPFSNNAVWELREKLNIKKAIPYTFYNTDKKKEYTEQKLRMQELINQHATSEDSMHVAHILKMMKYDAFEWEVPYFIYIITGILPVPPPASVAQYSPWATWDHYESLRNFGLAIPKMAKGKPTVEEMLENHEPLINKAFQKEGKTMAPDMEGLTMTMLGIKRTIYPVISLKRSMTKSELKKWIDKQWPTIEKTFPTDTYKMVANVSMASIFLGCKLFDWHVVQGKDWDWIMSTLETTWNFKNPVVGENNEQTVLEKYSDLLHDRRRLQQILTETEQRFKRFHPVK